MPRTPDIDLVNLSLLYPEIALRMAASRAGRCGPCLAIHQSAAAQWYVTPARVGGGGTTVLVQDMGLATLSGAPGAVLRDRPT